MRKFSTVLGLVTAVVMLAGCAQAERKLGRGIHNMTEITRLGEMQRAVEQTTLWEGPPAGKTVGVIHGMNRTIGRTLVGAFEVLTFPIPLPNGPIMNPEWGNSPDSYTPMHGSDPTLDSETNLGFSRGESFLILPGSRFRVFE